MKNFIRKLIIIFTFPLILIAQSGNGNLLYLEYSLDSDPGFGMGIRVPAQGMPHEEFNFNIDLSQVAEGLHVLFIRAYDSDGKFSETRYRIFYIDRIPTLPNFDKLYYAIDSEIKTNSLHEIPITSDKNIAISYTVDLTSLSEGLHTLFIVSKDQNGKMSHREPRIFYVDKIANTVSQNIKVVEYFIDSDPGFGMGIKIPIMSAKNISTNYIVPLTGLIRGFHFLHIRMLDDIGRWSSTNSRVFYIDDNPAFEDCTIKNMHYVINGTGYSSGRKNVAASAGNNLEEVVFNIDCSSLIVDSTYRISFFVESITGKQSVVYENQFLVKFGRQTFSILYESGWNLLSIPVENPNMLYTSIFPNTNAPVYTFNGEYKSVQNIPYSAGFWARFPNKDSVSIQGNRPKEYIDVKKGWNIIGGFPSSIPSSEIICEPKDIVTSQIFGYSNTTSYFSATSLEPSKGYWIKTNADGKINFIPNPNPAIKKIEIPDSWNKIAVSDGISIAKEIYLADSKGEYEYYELPPLPPASAFDARFSNNSLVETGSGLLKIQSPSNIITITATEKPIKLFDPFSSKEITLQKGEKITYLHSEASFTISNFIIPTEFKLFQNYPNPFNPETIIKFGIPERSKVKIEIFNILGERVAELLNTELDAGYHQVKWNGADLASGVYIYSIKTNSISDVKKMLLLK
jgi:hypothetical protein